MLEVRLPVVLRDGPEGIMLQMLTEHRARMPNCPDAASARRPACCNCLEAFALPQPGDQQMPGGHEAASIQGPPGCNRPEAVMLQVPGCTETASLHVLRGRRAANVRMPLRGNCPEARLLKVHGGKQQKLGNTSL